MFWDSFLRLCEENKTSPNSVVRKLGLSNAVCTHWKKRGTTPNGETLAKIAAHFDVSIDYLLYGEEKSPDDKAAGLSDKELKMISLMEKMSPEQKDAVLAMLQAMIERKK